MLPGSLKLDALNAEREARIPASKVSIMLYVSELLEPDSI